MDRQDIPLPPQTAYRKRLSGMLDLTYELEGLLHIGVTRSSVPPHLNQLIVNKLNALVALADEPVRPEELEAPAVEAPAPPSYDEEPELPSAAPEEENVRDIPEKRGALFSVNDRFLFTREMFGGELKNFDAAINELVTLDSVDEAEEYLSSEWNIDPENPVAIRFLGIISGLY